MSEELLAATVDDILSRHCPPDVVAAAEGTWAASVWRRLHEVGLTTVGIPEAAGGVGGTLAEAALVVRVAARHAAPVPLAETSLLAGWACAMGGSELPELPATLAMGTSESSVCLHRTGAEWVLDGEVPRVPWAWAVPTVVVIARSGGGIVAVPVDRATCILQRGWNLAGEPRDDLRFAATAVQADRVVALTAQAVEELRLRAALGRAVQLAGALEATLNLTVSYAREREQFGRAIGDFQAVQQSIAVLAGEVAAATASVEAALGGHGGGDWRIAVAAAKIRTGMASGTVARRAHQIHGTIGFTQEHRLQQLTRRLWSWRDEYGSERTWSLELGRELARFGPEGLWPALVRA